jgi:hypothetical protein
VIYLRAGLFAEGPTDYDFLIPLINRLLPEIAAREFPGNNEVEDTLALDGPGKDRPERISAALRAHEDEINLLIIHSDGDGDPVAAYRNKVEPGIVAARQAIPGKPVPAIGCVPVREIEAWLLADARVFEEQLGLSVRLPKNPETEADPKRWFNGLFASRRRRFDPFPLFGEQVRFSELRRLSAFVEFEHALTTFVQSQGPVRR